MSKENSTSLKLFPEYSKIQEMGESKDIDK